MTVNIYATQLLITSMQGEGIFYSPFKILYQEISRHFGRTIAERQKSFA
jgi:hypothetical protein